MILYLDTSALVKLYVAEEGSAEVKKRIQQADHVATAVVTYPEARSALARRQREGVLSARGIRRAVEVLDRDLDTFVIVELQKSVAHLAGELAESHALRGFDAIHLACALELGRLIGTPPAFLTFDTRQAAASMTEGLAD